MIGTAIFPRVAVRRPTHDASGSDSPGWAMTERIDPLSAVAARPVTCGILAISIALPLLTLLTRGSEIVSLVSFGAAFLALCAAAAMVIDRTRSHRPVLSARAALALYLLLTVVLGAAAVSTFTANALLRDDWAPLVAGLVMLALAPYRPAIEIALATAALVIVAAVLAVVQAPFALVSSAPISAVAGSSSLAMLGVASAAYAFSMNQSILRWRERAWSSAADTAAQQRGGVARSVQQQRVSVINQEVVPYLSRMSATEEVTEEDRVEARRLSRHIRGLLVADVERGWAQALMDDITLRIPAGAPRTVADDPDNLGATLTTVQRTLVRAIAIVAVEEVRAVAVVVRLRATPTGVTVRWELELPTGEEPPLRQLQSVLHLVRGLTRRSRVEPRAGGLVLEFHYEH